MSTLAVLGAGAFGTALAITLARTGRAVTLFARDGAAADEMSRTRRSGPRLPGFDLPESLEVSTGFDTGSAEILLLAIPMQSLGGLLADRQAARAPVLVSCMKGIDLGTGERASELLVRHRPDAVAAALTGPSFAIDLAAGLPTALTLACADPTVGEALQTRLSSPALRLYRTGDIVGAEFGGALKNVVALAAGIAIGAGLGDSARAALIARGMSEITRVATRFGAEPSTLAGLSGLGDLVLTATSVKSRNFKAGVALGQGAPLPEATTEGVATASAMARVADDHGIDAPILRTVAEVARGTLAVSTAVETLLARPLKEE